MTKVMSGGHVAPVLTIAAVASMAVPLAVPVDVASGTETVVRDDDFAQQSAMVTHFNLKLGGIAVVLTVPTVNAGDMLQERIVELRDLTAGWDGPGSRALAAAAVDTLDQAARALPAKERAALGASPHADGYISVTLTRDGVHRFADVYADRIEYEMYPPLTEQWEGALDAASLRAFLVG